MVLVVALVVVVVVEMASLPVSFVSVRFIETGGELIGVLGVWVIGGDGLSCCSSSSSSQSVCLGGFFS